MQIKQSKKVKKYLCMIIFFQMIISSCNELRELKEEDQLTECKNVYNDLVQDKNYEKFIGFHIVRRDNENTFFYKNLKTDSSEWQPPIQYHDDIQDLDKKTISFLNIVQRQNSNLI